MGALLDQFAAAGVRFERGDVGTLRALGKLTNELRTAIRAHKPAILGELAANDAATASPGQRQELRELITIILAHDNEAERTETLAVACADPDAALKLSCSSCGLARPMEARMSKAVATKTTKPDKAAKANAHPVPKPRNRNAVELVAAAGEMPSRTVA